MQIEVVKNGFGVPFLNLNPALELAPGPVMVAER